MTGLEAAARPDSFELFENFLFDFPEHDLNGAIGTAALHILFGSGAKRRTVGKARVFFFERREPVVVTYQRPRDGAE